MNVVSTEETVEDLRPLQCRCGACAALFDAGVPMPYAEFVDRVVSLTCPACGGVLAGPGVFEQQRSRPEDAMRRTALPSDGLEARIADWRAGGEWGRSAQAVFAFMTGALGPGRVSFTTPYPRTIVDLHRMILLFDRIPEWRERLPEMAALSPAWKVIVDNWRPLEVTYASEAGPLLDDRQSPKTAAFLTFLEDTLMAKRTPEATENSAELSLQTADRP